MTPLARTAWLGAAVLVAVGVWGVCGERPSRRTAAPAATDGAVAPEGAAPLAAPATVAAPSTTRTEVPASVRAELPTGIDVTDVSSATRLVGVRSSLGLVPFDAFVHGSDGERHVVTGERTPDALVVELPVGTRAVGSPGHESAPLDADASDVLLVPIASIVLFGTDLDARLRDATVAMGTLANSDAEQTLRGGRGIWGRPAPDARALAIDPALVHSVFLPLEVALVIDSGHLLRLAFDLSAQQHWRVDLDPFLASLVAAPTVRGRLHVSTPEGLPPDGDLEVKLAARRSILGEGSDDSREIATGDPALRVFVQGWTVPVESRVERAEGGWDVTFEVQAGHSVEVGALARETGAWGSARLEGAIDEHRLVLQRPVRFLTRVTPTPGGPSAWRVGFSVNAEGGPRNWGLLRAEFVQPADGERRVFRFPAALSDLSPVMPNDAGDRVMPAPGDAFGEMFAEGHAVRPLALRPTDEATTWDYVVEPTAPGTDALSALLNLAGESVPTDVEFPARGVVSGSDDEGVLWYSVVASRDADPTRLLLALESRLLEDGVEVATGSRVDERNPSSPHRVRRFADLPDALVWSPSGVARAYLCRRDGEGYRVVHIPPLVTSPVAPPPEVRGSISFIWSLDGWHGRAGSFFAEYDGTDSSAEISAPPGARVVGWGYGFVGREFVRQRVADFTWPPE